MKEEIKILFNQLTIPTLIITVILSMGMSILNAFSLLNHFNYFLDFGYGIASYLMLNAYFTIIKLDNEITTLLGKLNNVDLNKLNTFDIMKAHHNITFSKYLQGSIIDLKVQIKVIIPMIVTAILFTTLIELPKFNFGLSLELFSFSGVITLFNLSAFFISLIISTTLYLYSFRAESKRVHRRLNKNYQQVFENDK